MDSFPRYLKHKKDEKYIIFRTGKVYSLKCNRFLKPELTGGYRALGLYINCLCETTTLHKLIATYFVTNDDPIKNTIVNHINGVKEDNHADNLEWTTHLGNAKHAIENGLVGKVTKIIIKYDDVGEIVEEYNSSKEALEASGRDSLYYYRALKDGTPLLDKRDKKFYTWRHKYTILEEPLPEGSKSIPGYENYFATINGQIWSLHCKRFLKPYINGGKYHLVTVSHKGEKVHRTVHLLVMLAHVGERPKNKVIDHINGKRNDNRLENLRYSTYSENSLNGYKTGNSKGKNVFLVCPFTLKVLKKYSTRAEAARAENLKSGGIEGAIRLNKTYGGYQWVNNIDEIYDLREKVKKIFRVDSDTEEIIIYDSILEASQDMCCRKKSISKACRQEDFFKDYYWTFGFVWGFIVQANVEVPEGYEFEIVDEDEEDIE